MECKNQSSLECTLYNRNFVFALLLYFSCFFMFLVTIEYVYHLKKIQSLSLCKGSSSEITINYTSRFYVIAYIDSKHYIKSLTMPN